VVVYGLCDPLMPGVVRYVGSCMNLQIRLANHRVKTTTADARSRWVASVASQGRKIEAIILAHASSEQEADALERHYVELFRSYGWDITNSTTGGRKDFEWSEESRRKMSASARGNTHRRGSKHTASAISKMRAAKIGKRHTEETKTKMRAAHLGKKYKPMSAQGLENIRRERRGRWKKS
jgi:hypothetical protein